MRTEGFRGALLSALMIASITALALPILSPSPVHAALTSHAPIFINGNAGFTSPDPVNGGGSGTENDPYIIENYIIDASTAHGIEIRNTTAYFVVRNSVVENGGGTYYGISLNNVKNGKIDNNLLKNNQRGIRLSYSNNSLISNNLVEDGFLGIGLVSSENNLISNNNIENNSYMGIELDNSSNNTLDNNTCENNTSLGIYLMHSSSNNTLHNNVSRNNSAGGILLYESSSNNTIFSNTCENNNYYGIYIVSNSNNNRIFHNNLVNNQNQAEDYCSNYWDNGYPSGGNYWSDYTGADYYRGENQDIYGSDGIGDTQYYISGAGNQDRYPSMNPFPLPWTGTAVFSLVNLYTVNVEKILDLYQGSRLVVKFYRYDNVYLENENVIENFFPPWHVEENESARHPDDICVKKARLDLTTDNTENVISTIASFTVTKPMLEARFMEIPFYWSQADAAGKLELEAEFMWIPFCWSGAPS